LEAKSESKTALRLNAFRSGRPRGAENGWHHLQVAFSPLSSSPQGMPGAENAGLVRKTCHKEHCPCLILSTLLIKWSESVAEIVIISLRYENFAFLFVKILIF
jgi:hypothetical protein